jgi:translation initiation factor IF-3
MYRGREQAHREIGFNIAKKIIDDFGDTIVVEQQPQLAGRQLNFVIRSSGKKPVANNGETKGVENAETENS